MKTLIITQDIVQITSLKGIIGQTYSKLILNLQKLKTNLILKLVRPSTYKLITSPELHPSINQSVLYWDKLLSQNQLVKQRSKAWQITNQTVSPYFKFLKFLDIPFIKVWQTYLTIHLTHSFLAYHQALVRIINQYQPDKIIILGASPQEQIAKFLASQKNIKLINHSFVDFSFLNQKLVDWLYQRQIRQKITNFINLTKESKLNIKQNSLLLVASFFRHLKTLTPLQILLKSRTACQVIIDDPQTATNSHFAYLNPYLATTIAKKIYRQKHRLGKKIWHNWKFKSPPTSINQLTLQLLTGYLKTLALYAFPLTCLYLQASDNLIKQTKPQGVILVSDVRPLEVCLGLLARQHHIKSLLVSPNSMLSLDAINQFTLTDQVAVAGPYIKQQLIKLGVAKGKIHLIGDLRFSQLTSKKLTAYSKKVYQTLKLKPDKQLIFLASFRSNPQIPLEEKKQFFQISNQAVNQLLNAQLIIKPHPTETQAQVINQAKAWGLTNYIVTNNQQLSLLELLAASKVVLLTWSMTGFESLMLGTPVVVVNPTNKDYDQIIPYVKAGGAQLAQHSRQLQKILHRLLTNKRAYQTWVNNGRRFVSQYLQPPKSQVADEILKLLKSA